jgi:hypothetical protein
MPTAASIAETMTRRRPSRSSCSGAEGSVIPDAAKAAIRNPQTMFASMAGFRVHALSRPE